MRDLTLTVRISIDGEYLETEQFDVSIPKNIKEDDEMESMMNELRPLVLDEYGEYDEDEDEGLVSWELVAWEEY